ncbi:HEPN domain-containing protein [Acidisphaera sp. S103]|uniref:HEPN domain-containing protein n=1 Tax=Acidisphaera sp. S103 TaxID=1747223 RepID=UPI00131C4841|nr:HEPN domain-containing protein [Acidisphaera sp. S103]
MTPEAAQALETARRHLIDARAVVTLRITYIAGREAYLAAYHAAEAYLHHRTGKIAKTHRGLRTEFARLARSEPRIDPEFVRFLANAYEIKSIADYGAEPEANVSPEQANMAIETAGRLLECIAGLIGSCDGAES